MLPQIDIDKYHNSSALGSSVAGAPVFSSSQALKVATSLLPEYGIASPPLTNSLRVGYPLTPFCEQTSWFWVQSTSAIATK